MSHHLLGPAPIYNGKPAVESRYYRRVKRKSRSRVLGYCILQSQWRPLKVSRALMQHSSSWWELRLVIQIEWKKQMLRSSWKVKSVEVGYTAIACSTTRPGNIGESWSRVSLSVVCTMDRVLFSGWTCAFSSHVLARTQVSPASSQQRRCEWCLKVYSWAFVKGYLCWRKYAYFSWIFTLYTYFLVAYLIYLCK